MGSVTLTGGFYVLSHYVCDFSLNELLFTEISPIKMQTGVYYILRTINGLHRILLIPFGKFH